MKQLVLTGFKLLNEFPITEPNRTCGHAAEEMRILKKVVPSEEIALGRCTITPE